MMLPYVFLSLFLFINSTPANLGEELFKQAPAAIPFLLEAAADYRQRIQ